jgi:hypothetical protein
MHSVGLLYSAQEFLNFVADNRVIGETFESLRSRFGLAKPKDIYSISMRCNWFQLDDDGACILTYRGREIHEKESEEIKLRLQLQDLIDVFQPSWAIKLRDGRKELQEALPVEITQVFKEAGLFENWSEELIDWWDDLALLVRMKKGSELLKTGRKAEKLSFIYEENRTGRTPHWRSLESNYSGYDILSVHGPSNHGKVKIEVKGSELNLNNSFFYVTNNEWQTAERSEIYRFHLWLFKGVTRLIDLDSSDVAPHVPQDSGEGKWQNVRIPFKAFGEKATEIP